MFGIARMIGHVHDRLVARAVVGIGQSRVRARENHRQVVVADVLRIWSAPFSARKARTC